MLNSKRNKETKKSKRKKGKMSNSKVGVKPNGPAKSEKCRKISKSHVVKSEKNPIPTDRKHIKLKKRVEGKVKVKQEKV